MSSETGDRHIRVPVRVHERIKALKRDDETMGETVERLIGRYTLLDFAEEAAISEAEADELREHIVEANEAYAESVEEFLG